MRDENYLLGSEIRISWYLALARHPTRGPGGADWTVGFSTGFSTCGPRRLGPPQTFPRTLPLQGSTARHTSVQDGRHDALRALRRLLAAKTALPARSATKARAGQMIKMKPMGASAREIRFSTVSSAAPSPVASPPSGTLARFLPRSDACHHLRARDTPRQLRARLNRALRADNGSHFKDDLLRASLACCAPLVASSIAKVPDESALFLRVIEQRRSCGPVHPVH